MVNVDEFKELTKQIIGCAMQVHQTLRNGFQEATYQRALEIELTETGISYQRELEVPIYYRDRQIGTRRVDFLVQEKVLVELKAISKIDDIHLAQVINYLEAFKLPLGLLINFGEKSLYFKRFVKAPRK